MTDPLSSGWRSHVVDLGSASPAHLCNIPAEPESLDDLLPVVRWADSQRRGRIRAVFHIHDAARRVGRQGTACGSRQNERAQATGRVGMCQGTCGRRPAINQRRRRLPPPSDRLDDARLVGDGRRVGRCRRRTTAWPGTRLSPPPMGEDRAATISVGRDLHVAECRARDLSRQPLICLRNPANLHAPDRTVPGCSACSWADARAANSAPADGSAPLVARDSESRPIRVAACCGRSSLSRG